MEAKAKDEASILLFYIDAQTRALATVVEVAESIAKGRPVVLAIREIEEGCMIGGEAISGVQLKDLNRQRVYLRDLALRYSVPCFDSVGLAVQHVVEQHVKAREAEALASSKAESPESRPGVLRSLRNSLSPNAGSRHLPSNRVSPKLKPSRLNKGRTGSQ